MVAVPDEVSDDQAILISDIFPTGYQAAVQAEIREGDVVAVFGCGPVGQFAIASARLQGAGRVIAVDAIGDRLEAARAQGAEIVDYERDHPVEFIKEMTRGIGPDRVIDAVGVDAEPPQRGPAADETVEQAKRFAQQVDQVTPEGTAGNGQWKPGSAPSQVLDWAVQCVAKAGTVSIIGVYPPALETFPIGQAMMKNLVVKAGNCDHRRYIPRLLEMVRTGAVDPTAIVSRREPLTSAIEAYEAFDRRDEGWLKVKLEPAGAAV
jgi:threonine dehydrogenase-like Zn-dependent dehydrogenase